MNNTAYMIATLGYGTSDVVQLLDVRLYSEPYPTEVETHTVYANLHAAGGDDFEDAMCNAINYAKTRSQHSHTWSTVTHFLLQNYPQYKPFNKPSVR